MFLTISFSSNTKS